MRKRPTVSVLLVSRNGARFLPKCLSSLRKQDFRDFELVFVDNASTDGSWKMAKKLFPSCTLIRNEVGLGFCGGNNKGYPLCRGKYVLLLNNDTILPPDVLGKLVGTMETDRKIALVGASQYAFGEGLGRTPELGLFNLIGEGASAREEKDLDAQAVIACGLLRKEAFPGRIFDPVYGTGGEDIFLTLDARSRGWRVVQSAKARFWHHGTVRRGWEPQRFYNYERTGWLNYLRFYSSRTLFLLSPIVLAEWLMRTIVSILTLRFDKLWLRTKAQFWILANWRRVKALRRESLRAKKVPDSIMLRPFTDNRLHIFFVTTWRYLAYQAYIRALVFLKAI
jgi:GT2 family glycosyltransferase